MSVYHTLKRADFRTSCTTIDLQVGRCLCEHWGFVSCQHQMRSPSRGMRQLLEVLPLACMDMRKRESNSPYLMGSEHKWTHRGIEIKSVNKSRISPRRLASLESNASPIVQVADASLAEGGKNDRGARAHCRRRRQKRDRARRCQLRC